MHPILKIIALLLGSDPTQATLGRQQKANHSYCLLKTSKNNQNQQLKSVCVKIKEKIYKKL